MKHIFSNWDFIVSIATFYGLDVPKIQSSVGEIFRTSADLPWDRPSSLGLVLTTHISADV